MQDGSLPHTQSSSTAPDGLATPQQKASPCEYLYSAQEVAARLGVSERWVRDHATRRNPRLPAIKLGPLLRFRAADVEKFLAEQATHFPSRGRR